MRKMAIDKMSYSRQWLLAFIMYANDHNGQYPNGYEQATNYVDATLGPQFLQATNSFEIMYRGHQENLASPSSTIVLRETQAQQLPDGSYIRAYAFADGHVEMHKSADGNFSDWEQGKIAPETGTAGAPKGGFH